VNFKESKEKLINIFQQNKFSEMLMQKKFHSCEVEIQICSNKTPILISFPGYKAIFSKNKVIYDYCVKIIKNNLHVILSHTNIITDIFNKIKYGGMSANNLKDVLINLAEKGTIELSNTEEKLSYKPVAPSKELVDRVHSAHGKKIYNITGNSFDLTIEELLVCIKWIVLQEDINYPICDGYKGRKMPFERYLETIFITQNDSHSFEEVINRTLIHLRPPKWADMDYSFTDLIG